MCETVDPKEKYVELKPTYMWKVVNKKNKFQGPFMKTEKDTNGWAVKVEVKTRCWESKIYTVEGTDIKRKYRETAKGYHVFTTKVGAEDYLNMVQPMRFDSLKVQRVTVKGRSIKFKCGRNDGYVVETWK